MQTFKAISFTDSTSGKSKVVSVSFTPKEVNLYKRVKQLSSQEIRSIIGVSNYDELYKKADIERRTLSQFIKLQLEIRLKENPIILSAADVTFKNSKETPYQRWYPYIEGFSPNFVISIIQNNLSDKCLIYEPFAGTGTTVFAADLLGFETIYSEINPLLQHLIKTKLAVLKLKNIERVELADNLLKSLNALLKFNFPEDKKLRENYSNVFSKSVYFPEKNFSMILKAKTFLRKFPEGIEKNVLLIGILSSLISSSFLKKQGDLRFKTKKELNKGTPIFSDILRQNINVITSDLKSHLDFNLNSNHSCIIENAKKIGEVNCSEIGCVITSPPYLNGTNYIRNTKLELWFMECLKSLSDLRHYRDEILTSGINDVKLSNKNLPELDAFSPVFKDTLEQLQLNAYDVRIPHMAKCYFSEMFHFFSGLRTKLSRHASVFIDIGDSIFNNVHIKTDIILIQLAEYLGYKLVDNTKLRERRSRNGQIISQMLIHLSWK